MMGVFGRWLGRTLQELERAENPSLADELSRLSHAVLTEISYKLSLIPLDNRVFWAILCTKALKKLQ